VLNKFSDSKCLKIGYPKYMNPVSTEIAKKNIRNVFDIENNRPLILWMPTYIKGDNENGSNIGLWVNFIAKLKDDFNIIVRPHPKTISTNVDVIDILKEYGFLLMQKWIGS